MRLYKKLYTYISSILFPTKCIVCGNSADGICLSCLAKRERNPNTLPKNMYSLFSYKDPVIRRLIRAIKYNQKWSYADAFGVLLHEEITEILHEKMYTPKRVTLCPIPSSHTEGRVVNHAAAIAHAIAAANPSFYQVKNLLKKEKTTTPQALIKNRNERLKNMKNVFVVNQTVLNLKNETVVIVDDVSTTGATLGDAMRAFRQAETRACFAITIAH